MTRHGPQDGDPVNEWRSLSAGVRVVLIPTADNASGMFTKVLDTKVFQKHRATVMNLLVGDD